MELENRYIVFKRKHLTEGQEEIIYGIAATTNATVDCLVIEEDWPEYEPTLKLLSDRVDREAGEEVEGEVDDEAATNSLSNFLDEWNIINPFYRQIAIKAWHKALSSAKYEHIATVLPSDPYDERSGFYLSLEDSRRLEVLPPGTYLYVVKP